MIDRAAMTWRQDEKVKVEGDQEHVRKTEAAMTWGKEEWRIKWKSVEM